MMRRARAWWASQDPEQGSVTFLVLVLSAALLMTISLVYDGATKLRAAREATSIAAEAGRAAGQVITADSVTGAKSSVDPSGAVAAARSYLTQTGHTGTVNVSGDTITVTATTTWNPTFTGVFDNSPRTVTGDATVSVKRVLSGVEQ